jgi:hypothetical protein
MNALTTTLICLFCINLGIGIGVVGIAMARCLSAPSDQVGSVSERSRRAILPTTVGGTMTAATK